MALNERVTELRERAETAVSNALDVTDRHARTIQTAIDSENHSSLQEELGLLLAFQEVCGTVIRSIENGELSAARREIRKRDHKIKILATQLRDYREKRDLYEGRVREGLREELSAAINGAHESLREAWKVAKRECGSFSTDGASEISKEGMIIHGNYTSLLYEIKNGFLELEEGKRRYRRLRSDYRSFVDDYCLLPSKKRREMRIRGVVTAINDQDRSAREHLEIIGGIQPLTDGTSKLRIAFYRFSNSEFDYRTKNIISPILESNEIYEFEFLRLNNPEELAASLESGAIRYLFGETDISTIKADKRIGEQEEEATLLQGFLEFNTALNQNRETLERCRTNIALIRSYAADVYIYEGSGGLAAGLLGAEELSQRTFLKEKFDNFAEWFAGEARNYAVAD